MKNEMMPKSAPSIMVVDDTPANLHLLAGMLNERGFRVRPVSNGKFALQSARHSPPDLILLDIMMPEMNGYQVCEALKADEQLADIPVIFISALNETTDKVKGFQVGAVDFVTKPFQFAEVQARVATHLELHRQKRLIEDANAQLRLLEEQRDSLVHMVVHDMRTPLTAVYGFLMTLESLEGERLTDDGREYVHTALTATQELVEMVNSLLDVSKMEANEMKLTLSPCDLRTMAKTAIGKLDSLKGDRQLQLIGGNDPVTVLADADLIARVMQNLLGNALKFTANNGTISVRIEANDTVIRVLVADNGPGVPLAFQQRIFEKFGQVDHSQDSRRYSTGLGLTFCKLAVEAHHGDIGVESEEGKGSTFWFTLPMPKVAATIGIL